MEKLTARQERFVAEYCVDQNGKQAAIRAGYSEKSAETEASHLLAKPHVRAAADAKLKRLMIKTEITAEYVLSSLKEVAERCMQRKPVMYFDKEMKEMRQEEVGVIDPATGDIKSEGVWEFDSSGATKALELLGKHIKLFTDKVEHSGGMSLTELVKRARGEDK